MIRKSRNLVLDVFDYGNNKLCTLYDNSVDSSGQAYDVFIMSERNGWKELSFSIPTTINTDNGIEPNYRLDYIKAGYRIRSIDDNGIDWFLITKPSQTHNGKSKNASITAGHISQLLKVKRLDLEFSDKEGNNVGTAEELLYTILEGTGWMPGYVETFLEKDNATVKKRSMKASAKTGAFKLISNMCTLFDAKPVYHGNEQTVDIVPINPFSRQNDGELPDVTKADGVIELAYSQNITNVTRTENGENIATKLYAYGSYGDNTNGYCGIDECLHNEHVYTLDSNLEEGETYYFSYVDDSGMTIFRHFTADRDIPAGSTVVYSLMDPASQMYVWVQTETEGVFEDIYENYWFNEDTGELTAEEWDRIVDSNNVNGHAYYVESGNTGVLLPYSSEKVEMVQNWFSFLMDFEYFKDVNLLTDAGLQRIAGYQRFAAALYKDIYIKSLQMSTTRFDLSKIIGEVNFCKLDVSQVSSNGGNVCVRLNKTTYPDGIIYRSDYDINTKEHFQWIASPALKTNGDPKTTGASMLFVVHNTTPTTWTKAYLKSVDNKDDPTYLTFNLDYDSLPAYQTTDRYFLFGSNNINGELGGLEINDEANTTAINNKTKIVTVNHYVRFGTTFPTIIPANDPGASSILDYDLEWYKINNFGWFWLCDNDYNTSSRLYFSYYDHFNVTETTWRPVHFQTETPPTPAGGVVEYWYDWSKAILYRYMNSQWTKLEAEDEKKVAAMFGQVYKACRTRDEYYKGIYENYTYTVSTGTLNAGNYFISGPYDKYHVFTITEALTTGDKLTYSTNDRCVILTKDGTLAPISADLTMESGTLGPIGEDVEDTTKCRSAEYIAVTPGQDYSLMGLSSAYPITIYKYNSSHEFVDKIENLSGYDGIFSAETGINYIKITCNTFAEIFNRFTTFKILIGTKKVIETKDYRFDNVYYTNDDLDDDSKIVIEEQIYTKLIPVQPSGRMYGIVGLIKEFADTADTVFITDFNALKYSQDTLSNLDLFFSTSLGHMYSEGFWQKKDYVDGDEDKLYEDALDTIREISHPKATYQITYLDQYGIEDDETNGVSSLTANTRWPDLTTTSAAHLIDDEININCWAYIDKVNKCYDQPMKTTISINTDLSTMSQHSFTDVMSSIADVANSVKAKEELIDRASAISEKGRFDANKLQGAIDASKLVIVGGSSTWYTDDKGNIIFESADKHAAMTLTGAGFAIANSKNEWGEWNWRTMGTGDGIIADEITTGYLSANLIEAGSITTEKISNDFGATIDLSGNAITQRVENVESEVSTISQTAGEIVQTVESLSEDVSRIDQRADEIIQTVDNLEGTVSEIDQKADEITQTVSGLGNDVTRIDQKADGIAQSVEDLDDDLSSRIEQTTEEISQTITDVERDMNSKIEQTSDGILLELRGMQLGGRNYLRNSSNLDYSLYYIQYFSEDPVVGFGIVGEAIITSVYT